MYNKELLLCVSAMIPRGLRAFPKLNRFVQAVHQTSGKQWFSGKALHPLGIMAERKDYSTKAECITQIQSKKCVCNYLVQIAYT